MRHSSVRDATQRQRPCFAGMPDMLSRVSMITHTGSYPVTELDASTNEPVLDRVLTIRKRSRRNTICVTKTSDLIIRPIIVDFATPIWSGTQADATQDPREESRGRRLHDGGNGAGFLARSQIRKGIRRWHYSWIGPRERAGCSAGYMPLCH
jgi:hypothetical protein